MLDRLTIERMAALSPNEPIVVALSGGGDSAALLQLMADAFGQAKLRAVIVDHALREGSAADALRAAAQAQAAGVCAHVATLSWPQDETRSQQSARARRYGALSLYARSHGARIVALGHTADDQAETLFMRAAAHSSWRGLAGMALLASAPLWPQGRGILVARPLLGARREDLRAFLRHRGLNWIEDPANANQAYERVRVRARLSALAQFGFDPMRLVQLAARLRPIADAIERAAAQLIERTARFEADRIIVSPDYWGADDEVRRRTLAALVAASAGAQRQAPPNAIERLDGDMRAQGFRGATLAGAQISPSGAGFALERDRGAIEGRADGAQPIAALPLPADVETVWDGRLALRPQGGDFVAHPAMPEPRLVANGPTRSSGGVAKRWLLAERVAHALNQPANRINVPKL